MDIGEIFAPVNVNGSNSAPLFTYLKKKCPGNCGPFINSNFTIFLVDENGVPIKRISRPFTIDALKYDVDEALKFESNYVMLENKTNPPFRER